MSKKWILFLFAALFLLFFTVQLVLQSGLFSEKAKAYAEKGLERLLGRPIQIGEVELRSLSASVVLKGVSARPIGDVSPFSAQEIRVYFSPWSLLTQSFFIRQIVIESPSIALTPALLSQPPLLAGATGGRPSGGRRSDRSNQKRIAFLSGSRPAPLPLASGDRGGDPARSENDPFRDRSLGGNGAAFNREGGESDRPVGDEGCLDSWSG
ncbi:MAG: hypothetical protein MPW17_16170 [Candidatus Manganitrophus sp.]|nr:hypothetical protein [Candidatus Manganitrophus sp.]MDC4224687.1 hypothetical protein [Candidatus Manganitrophus sp.]WDT70283.1 MAG: hypothetical protein MPW17_16170 [Candidatus Manganitrophus sp.]